MYTYTYNKCLCVLVFVCVCVSVQYFYYYIHMFVYVQLCACCCVCIYVLCVCINIASVYLCVSICTYILYTYVFGILHMYIIYIYISVGGWVGGCVFFRRAELLQREHGPRGGVGGIDLRAWLHCGRFLCVGQRRRQWPRPLRLQCRCRPRPSLLALQRRGAPRIAALGQPASREILYIDQRYRYTSPIYRSAL